VKCFTVISAANICHLLVFATSLRTRVVNETYDAETETRRSKQRLETFARDKP